MKRHTQGAAFSEHIKTEKLSRISHNEKYSAHVRSYLLPLTIIIIGIVLFCKLFFLQIIFGNYYRVLSDTNRTRTTIIHAPRGVIFDRAGVALVYNTAGFRKMVKGKTVQLTQDEAINLLAKNENNLEIDSLRKYPYADAFSHVIGYVGQISKAQLSLPDFSGYQSGDIVGQMGLEQEYEKTLRGTDGKSLYEIDAMGKIVRKLGQTDPAPGQDITTTLDYKLQLAAYDAMKNVKKGAVIVTTPNGQILALVSKPSFDPNLFTLGSDYHASTSSAYQNVSQILLDGQNQPLLNRAISGTYPPGSTFKIVNAAAGLEDNVIDQNFLVNDTGILRVGDFSFANWYYTGYGKTEGKINVVTAIKRSNDIFFYTLANMIGVDRLSAFAKKFGLGSELGIDLPGEAIGLVPTKEWKQKTFGEEWYLGDDYHYGIGQGYLLTTPLQVNAWTQAIANNGTEYVPHLLKNQESKIINHDFISQKNIDLIRQGMIEVCSPGGVAYPLFNYAVKNPKLIIDGQNITQAASMSAQFRHVVVACKTGTAEQGDATAAPHAWITLFAPAYKPQIIITVLSEASGEGSDVAAPIAKKILDAWFSR